MTRAVEVTGRRDFNGGMRLKLRQGSRSFDAVSFDPRLPASSGESQEGTYSKPETRNPKLVPGVAIDLVYRLSENEWNGTTSVELKLVDTKASA